MKSPAEEMFCFNNLQLVVHPVKGWIVSKHGEEYVLRDQQLNGFLVWLPLLESDSESFIRFADSQPFEFPFISLLNVALTSYSPYWVSLTLPWLMALEERMNLSDLVDPIRQCLKDKNHPQATRHGLMKILAGMKSANTFYETSDGFHVKSYRIGHSEYILESDTTEIIFQGVLYFEHTRIYRGLKINRLSNEEYNRLLEYKPHLKNQVACRWKLETIDGPFIVVSMSVRVIEHGETVFRDWFKRSFQ